MSQSYRIVFPQKKLIGKLNLPGSKSEANRLLILRDLFPNSLFIENLSVAQDTVTMESLLQHKSATYDCGPAGTVFRFLTARLALREGEHIITGSERLKERPIEDLVHALRSLGADIEYLEKEGFAPLKIVGKQLKGGEVSLDAGKSSQFISALMMIAPSMTQGLIIRTQGTQVSTPYIYLTAHCLDKIGVKTLIKNGEIRVESRKSDRQTKVYVEPDWSAASYWFGMALLAEKAEIYMPGLRLPSTQGDAAMARYFEPLGLDVVYTGAGIRLIHEGICKPKKQHVHYDLLSTPDLLQTLVVALGAIGQEAHFSGLHTLRFKETDRLLALETELKKVGVTFRSENNTAELSPSEIQISGPEFDSWDDHRMAMSLSMLALLGEIQINDPAVVEKSYPGFWEDLRRMGARVW